MRRSPKRLVILLLLATQINLGACSDEFQKGDLVGTYVLNAGVAKDTLELKSDGDYIHGYRENEASRETLTGKWELEKTPDGQVVTLGNFRPLPRENTNSSGYYLLKPTRFLGSIRLVRNADLNEFYERQ